MFQLTETPEQVQKTLKKIGEFSQVIHRMFPVFIKGEYFETLQMEPATDNMCNTKFADNVVFRLIR